VIWQPAQWMDIIPIMNPNSSGIHLSFTLLCDDVRLEAGNKLSFMGVFQNIMVEQLPVSLIKFAVINHWEGEGRGTTEVRVLSPDRSEVVVASASTPLDLAAGGFTDNVSFFVNVVLPQAGTYTIQTLLDSEVVDEFPFVVTDASEGVIHTTPGSGTIH